MGDRGQILIKGGVYLYTHYNASELETILSEALRGGRRWSDSEYLARIIFCRMVRDDVDGELGYGIGTELHGDVWKLIEVDCGNQLITVKTDREGEGDKFEKCEEYSFEKFVLIHGVSG